MRPNEVASFRDLAAWQVPMELVLSAYAIAGRLPATERFELSAQIRRAATSVPANVAEGHATGRCGRYLYHLGIALGSLAELETHFEVALRLRFVNRQELAVALEQLQRSGQIIHGLVRSLRRKRLQQGLSAIVVVALLFVLVG